MSFLGIVTLVLVALIILGWFFGFQVREIKIEYQLVELTLIGLKLVSLNQKILENGLVM